MTFLFFFPVDLGNKLSPSKKMKTRTPSNENVAEFDFGTAPRLQIMADKQAILDKDEEEYVRSWELLQSDIECLHSIYSDLHELVEVCFIQQEMVADFIFLPSLHVSS